MRGTLARRWIDRDGTLSDRARTCDFGGRPAVALSQQVRARPLARRHRHRTGERDALCPAGDLLVAKPGAEPSVLGRQPMKPRRGSRQRLWSDYCRYCWMRVVRSPARPCWSIEYCQERNSSTVSVYRAQASSSDSKPPRTAATTSALRRMTQRLVVGGGRSAMVSGLPSGPITYLTLGRWGSVIGVLTSTKLTNTWRTVHAPT